MFCGLSLGLGDVTILDHIISCPLTSVVTLQITLWTMRTYPWSDGANWMAMLVGLNTLHGFSLGDINNAK